MKQMHFLPERGRHPADWRVTENNGDIVMMDIQDWIDRFARKLEAAFPNRVWFIGLQGSYGRGEATTGSDIDVVAILDELHTDDLQKYNAMLDNLTHRESICGFIAGKAELLNWEPSDLFQFFHDTVPVKGSLDALASRIDAKAVERAIHMGACNIYHACVHNMVHEKDPQLLKGLYKSAAFVVQAIHYRETGIYIRQKAALLEAVKQPERRILKIGIELKAECDMERARFFMLSEELFLWAKSLIHQS